MRLSTPCSRMRSSLVETSSSGSSFLTAFFAVFCTARAEKGVARVEVATAEVPTRKVRRDVFMIRSSMRVSIALGAHAYKQYSPGRVLTVNRREKIRLG